MSDLTRLTVAITSRGFLAGPPTREASSEDAEGGGEASELEAAPERASENDRSAAPTDLRIDTLRSWLEPLEFLEHVRFTGPGDPLLHPRVAYLVRVARDAGAYVSLETGATVLEGRLVHDLIEAGLDELRVRLDAWSREGYLRLRNEDRYSDVLRKLTQLKDQKRMMLIEHPVVTLVLREPGRAPKGRGRHGQSFSARLGAARVDVLPAPPIPAPAPVEAALDDGLVVDSVEAVEAGAIPAPPPETTASPSPPETTAAPEPPAAAASPAPATPPAPAEPAPPCIPHIAVDGRVYASAPAPDARSIDPAAALGDLAASSLAELLAN